MTSEYAHLRPEIRRLWNADKAKLVDHFQRLDQPTRRLRFAGIVNDHFVKDYAEHILSPDSLVFGAFPDGTLRGVAELRGVLARRDRSAEIALLVEPEWQHEGIGDALLNRLVAAAQNRGIKSLHMLCLRENKRMQKLAKKHDATLEFDMGDVEARLDPPWPTPMSMFEEMYGETRTYLRAMFRMPQ